MTKLLSRTTILTSKFFTVYENKLEFSNGSHATHKVALRDSSVAVFPLDKEGNIYLIDQYRYLLQKRIIEAASGMIENDESPLDTAKKELKEEVGIVAKKWRLLRSLKAAGSIITWDQTLFLAQDLDFGDQKLEEAEDIKVVKFPLTKAVDMVLNGKIVTASTSIGILIIDKLRQEGKI